MDEGGGENRGVPDWDAENRHLHARQGHPVLGRPLRTQIHQAGNLRKIFFSNLKFSFSSSFFNF